MGQSLVKLRKDVGVEVGWGASSEARAVLAFGPFIFPLSAPHVIWLSHLFTPCPWMIATFVPHVGNINI